MVQHECRTLDLWQQFGDIELVGGGEDGPLNVRRQTVSKRRRCAPNILALSPAHHTAQKTFGVEAPVFID